MDAHVIAEHWRLACADAGVDATSAFLFPYERQFDRTMPTAAYFRPGVGASPEELQPLTRPQRAAFGDHIGAPRITVFVGLLPVIFAAKLRHELEHVRQWAAAPDGDALDQLYQCVLSGAGAFVGIERRASAVLYNLIPFESDANSASSTFVRRRFSGDEVDALAGGEDGVLVRPSTVVPEPQTVALRSLALVALGAEHVAAELAASDADTPESIAERLRLSAEWHALLVAPGRTQIAASARALIPTTADVDEVAPDFRAAWLPLRRLLGDGMEQLLAAARTTSD